ncbi:MAG: protein-export chaperone SecB [Thermodesulfobacteriota bacterium]
MPQQFNLKLNKTRLKSFNFRVNEEHNNNDEIQLNFGISNAYHYEYKEKKIYCLVSVSINQEDCPFFLDIDYEGVFEVDRRVSKKRIEPFGKINCPAILFPFLRECIADITRRADLEPLLLPAINFVELAKQKSQE